MTIYTKCTLGYKGQNYEEAADEDVPNFVDHNFFDFKNS